MAGKGLNHQKTLKNAKKSYRGCTILLLKGVTHVKNLKIMLETNFLGGLSLHLNHLIVERVSTPYWQFGTLPIGIFLSNLDSRQLETSLMTSYCHF